MNWPSIPLFESLVYTAKALVADGVKVIPGNVPVVTYYAKPKRDGTFAAIERLADGTIIYHSRNKIITPGDDNFGFAAWASKLSFSGDKPFVIYGEWAGRDIQRDMSDSLIERHFFIFGLETEGVWESEPEEIWSRLARIMPIGRDRVRILPEVQSLRINILDPQPEVLKHINDLVASAETVDPYMKEEFGVEGPGEGFVYRAYESWVPEELRYFKAKATKTRVKATKAAASATIDKLAADTFVSTFVTDARCRQFAGAEPYQKRNTGNFVNALEADVFKESKAEIEVSGLSANDLRPLVKSAARDWYLKRSV